MSLAELALTLYACFLRSSRAVSWLLRFHDLPRLKPCFHTDIGNTTNARGIEIKIHS
jgi:hypothetical protein